MKIIFAGDTVTKGGIFLAGPTPGKNLQLGWRPSALLLFNAIEFGGGQVFVPETKQAIFEGERESETSGYYMQQVEWEHKALEACDVVMFWVPREIPDMMALTTNVEFGRYIGKKPCIYGRPTDAPKCGYLDWYFKKMTGQDPLNALNATVTTAYNRYYGLSVLSAADAKGK